MADGYKLMVKHVRQIVQVSSTRQKAKYGPDMKNVDILEGETGGYSLLVDR